MIDHFLRSLLRQLAAAAEAFPTALLSLASEFRRSGREPSVPALSSALNSTIKSLDQDIFIVVDALDECPDKADHAKRQDLLDQIKELLFGQHENLHLLATSRKELDIQESLQGLATAQLDIQTAFRGDIELFVKKRLEETPRLARWSLYVKAEVESRLLQVGEP